MVLKANIKPELEDEIGQFFKAAGAKSKTDYVNKAVEDFNRRFKREQIIKGMQAYFADPRYQKEARERLREFAAIRYSSD